MFFAKTNKLELKFTGKLIVGLLGNLVQRSKQGFKFSLEKTVLEKKEREKENTQAMLSCHRSERIRVIVWVSNFWVYIFVLGLLG